MHKVTKLNSASVARLLQARSSTMTGVTAGRVRSLSSGASVEHPAPPPRAPQGNEVSLFGPKDQRLPLPGKHQGFCCYSASNTALVYQLYGNSIHLHFEYCVIFIAVCRILTVINMSLYSSQCIIFFISH